MLDVQKSLALFKESNIIDIGAGNKNLWISFKIFKYSLNNEATLISFNPQSTPTYSPGNTRISFGYFGTDSNNQSDRMWFLKYGDDQLLKSSKSVIINQATTFVIKLVLSSDDMSDETYFYVNPNSTKREIIDSDADLEIKK